MQNDVTIPQSNATQLNENVDGPPTNVPKCQRANPVHMRLNSWKFKRANLAAARYTPQLRCNQNYTNIWMQQRFQGFQNIRVYWFKKGIQKIAENAQKTGSGEPGLETLLKVDEQPNPCVWCKCVYLFPPCFTATFSTCLLPTWQRENTVHLLPSLCRNQVLYSQSRVYTGEFVYNDFGYTDSLPITTLFRRSRQNYLLRVFEFGYDFGYIVTSLIASLFVSLRIIFCSFITTVEALFTVWSVRSAMWSHHQVFYGRSGT